MTRELLRRTSRTLKAYGIREADNEAELLLRHYGRMNRVELFTEAKTLTADGLRRLRKALAIRRKRFALAVAIGEWEFLGIPLSVTRDCLVPRPETEVLALAAQEVLTKEISQKPGKPIQVLDIGTGSGALAVYLTRQHAACRMTALDISPKALLVARQNAHRHKLSGRIRFYKSDLFKCFGRSHAAFWDIIVANPPYIPDRDWRGLSPEVRHEPRKALLAGPDGLRVIRKILAQAPRYLNKGGKLFMEIGKGQAKAVKKILSKDSRYGSYSFIKDLRGIDRVLVARTELGIGNNG